MVEMKRIQKALKGGKAGELAELLPDIEQTAQTARKREHQAHEAALDPMASAAEVERLRRESDDARFTAQRLDNALAALRAALEDARQAERRTATRQNYDNALAARDAIVARLRNEYPEISGRLVSLLSELADATAAVCAANRDLPEGAEKLEMPENLARPDSKRIGSVMGPLSLLEVALPDLDDSTAVSWPPVFNAQMHIERRNPQEIAKEHRRETAGQVAPSDIHP